MSNFNNLQKEILGIHLDANKLEGKTINLILKAYKKSLEEVRTEIARIYIRYAIDGVIRLSSRQRYTVLKELERQLIEQATTLGLLDVEHTTNLLEDVYSESFYKTAYVLDSGVDISINFALLNPEMIRAAVNMPIEGKMFSDRIWQNKELLIERIRLSVENAMSQGTSIDKLARDVKNNFGSSAYESERLIRTEVARCHSLAQNEIYSQSGLVTSVMWSAALESERTCEDCQSLDGRVFDLDDTSKPEIPLHPLCRCAFIPYLPNWNPTRRRDQDTREIIDYKTYASWKKSKGIKY